jgi:hypothetical protein
MADEIEYWIDLSGLADTLWQEDGFLCISRDYPKKTERRDTVWLTQVRQTLRKLGYKITRWESVYSDCSQEFIHSENLTTNIPYEIYEERGAGNWNEWIEEVSDDAFIRSESPSVSVGTDDDPIQ